MSIFNCWHYWIAFDGRYRLQFSRDRCLPTKTLREPDDDRAEIIVGPVVYRTHQIPYKPPKACDFYTTEERWFIKPIRMERIGYLNIHSLLNGNVELSEALSTVTLDLATLSR